jgi:arsenate reductase
MAEGFGRAYGSDVMKVASAGLFPTEVIAAETIETMLDKNIDISHHVPKQFVSDEAEADIIINMSGQELPPTPYQADVRDWQIEDPYGRSMSIYQRSCLSIEIEVMRLILELRRSAS